MNRQEWLEWRQRGIGSSDAPIIMDVSPWATPLDLFETKTATEVKEDMSNSYIKDKGNEMEGKIRSLYELKKMRSYAVALVERQIEGLAKPLLASLDGRSEDFKELIEIKLLGKEDYEAARDEKIVPEKYVPQIQHQLMVEERAEICTFLGYPYERDFDGNMDITKLVEIPVKPDLDYQSQLLQKEIEFIDLWTKGKPPVPSERDYKSFRTLLGLTPRVKKWKQLKAKSERIDAEIAELRKEIESIVKKDGHPRFVGAGVRIRLESRAGTVNYKKIIADFKPELLEHENDYRGKGSLFYKMEVVDDVE